MPGVSEISTHALVDPSAPPDAHECDFKNFDFGRLKSNIQVGWSVGDEVFRAG